MRGVILIVEDSEPCVTTLELALQGMANMETRSAGTVAEALEILARDGESIRAVVTDLNLPTTNGFEFIEIIRRTPTRATLPILVTSGDSDPGNPARLRNLGANAYFVKPYSPAALRRALEKLLDAA